MARVLAAVVVAGLVCATAASAAPPPSARYRGKTSQHRPISLRVTSDGRGLQMEFDQVFRCNRGPKKVAHAVYRKQRPEIRPDGTFSYTKTFRDLAPIPGFAERHDEHQRVTGSFGDGDGVVHGRITTSDVGRSGLQCRSAVTFTARKAK